MLPEAQQFLAYAKGREARAKGKPSASNPYPSGDAALDRIWAMGWEDENRFLTPER